MLSGILNHARRLVHARSKTPGAPVPKFFPEDFKLLIRTFTACFFVRAALSTSAISVAPITSDVVERLKQRKFIV